MDELKKSVSMPFDIMCSTKKITAGEIPELVKNLKDGEILVIEFEGGEENNEESEDGEG